MMGQEDNSNFIKDLLDMELEDSSIPTAQTVLIERIINLDE